MGSVLAAKQSRGARNGCCIVAQADVRGTPSPSLRTAITSGDQFCRELPSSAGLVITGPRKDHWLNGTRSAPLHNPVSRR